jgi:hypothetical protein
MQQNRLDLGVGPRWREKIEFLGRDHCNEHGVVVTHSNVLQEEVHWKLCGD